MASFDYRLNPLYPIKECSSCGALYTTDYCCFEGSLMDKIICDLNKTPDLFLELPQNCPKCVNPVDGQYCQGCALLRIFFKEDLFTYCIENRILQDSSEPSNDNTNVVNDLQDPFVVKQDPGKNSSQSPLQINHQCGYGCGFVRRSDLVHDSPNIFNPPPQPPLYSCEFCENDARYGHYCTPQGPHEAYQRQPMNEDYYHEQNSCYDPNSFGFDQFQPPYYTVNHQIFNAQNDLFNSQNKLMEQLTSMCDMVGQYIQKKEEKQIEEKQAAKARYWKIPVCYDDDDDEDYTIVITPKEPDNSLSTLDEHFDTVLATESDEFIKSSVENLVPNPMMISHFMMKTFRMKSIRKIDSLFDEFTGKLTLLKSIMSRINETDCDPEEETRLIKRLLYDNSSPRPPKEFISDNSDTAFESFSPFPIPVEDSDSLMEEIDLSFTPDDPMSLGIDEDDYDFERDILILEELLSNDSLSLLENESFHFDILSSSRPPAKPPNRNSGILNVKVMGDISEHKVPMPRLMLTLVPNKEKLLISYLIRAIKLLSLLLNAR
nr:hypothetical protein [Tanacetum cinerariifolium]